jgi:hypothetical protein
LTDADVRCRVRGMKKRAKTTKAAARKTAAKKPTKSAKPAKAARPPAGADKGKYTPTPIQGIGWAPFRYPL